MCTSPASLCFVLAGRRAVRAAAEQPHARTHQAGGGALLRGVRGRFLRISALAAHRLSRPEGACWGRVVHGCSAVLGYRSASVGARCFHYQLSCCWLVCNWKNSVVCSCAPRNVLSPRFVPSPSLCPRDSLRTCSSTRKATSSSWTSASPSSCWTAPTRCAAHQSTWRPSSCWDEVSCGAQCPWCPAAAVPDACRRGRIAPLSSRATADTRPSI